MALATDAGCRTIAPLAFCVYLSINLHQLCEVDIFTERAIDCLPVEIEAITRQLNPICEAARKVCHKVTCRDRVALTYHEAGNQFCVRVDSRPGPNITADTVALNFLRRHVLLFATNELPDFINLNPLTGQIPHGLVKKLGTGRAELNQEFQDGMLRRASHANR
jgi:hypothetical protein